MEKLMNFVFVIVITIFVFGLTIGLFAIITWTPFFGVLSFLKEAPVLFILLFLACICFSIYCVIPDKYWN